MKWLSTLILILLVTASCKVWAAEGPWVQTSLSNKYIETIETTYLGVLAGENDSRVWLSPLNGIYISKDLGETWQAWGLKDRGVTDIATYKNYIYAATYYFVNNEDGLYEYSFDLGQWRHLGPNFSAAKVARDAKTIYLGGYEHGLWVSMDNGSSWVQKLGTGWFGPEIKAIESTDTFTLVATVAKTYISTNQGETWKEIAYLNGKGITTITSSGKVILAGSESASNTYISFDQGNSWKTLPAFTTIGVTKLKLHQGYLYAASYVSKTNSYKIYKSADFGTTLLDTGMGIEKKILDLTGVSAEPNHLLGAISSKGVYKHTIPQPQLASFPFMEAPWKTTASIENTANIAAYFDHEYPLFSYDLYKEPQTALGTTWMYYGYRLWEPYIFYSSHGGTDYKLPMDTPITAVAQGYAKYYYCKDCGNSLKINHENGYQTTYMHLRGSNLLTTQTTPIWVNSGDVLGYVGMTGNTNGPHLHFEVTKDTNDNGYFDDEYPNGRVDPYGWQDTQTKDPWETFSWTDAKGAHQGTKSYYLWKTQASNYTKFFSMAGSLIAGNKTITFDDQVFKRPITLLAKSLGIPIIPANQEYLTAVKDTAVDIKAFDQTNEAFTVLGNPAKLSYTLANDALTGLISDSVAVYTFDATTHTWQKLPTIVDLTTKEPTITGTIAHLSEFAVFGIKEDAIAPHTVLTIVGNKSANWFNEYPTITLLAEEANPSSAIKTYFTTTGEGGWQEYVTPLKLEKDGFTKLEYRSMNTADNLEPTQEFIFQIDTKGIWKKQLTIQKTNFISK